MKVQVTIEGVMPLLMNRFTDEAEIAASSGHVRNVRETPREQAARTAYVDDKTGELYVPGPNIAAALVEGGRFHKSSLVSTGLRVSELVVPLGTKEYEVDSRPVRMPGTRDLAMRHRARVDRWRASFTLEVDEDIVSMQLVRTLVDDAGRKIGLGDFRPAMRGPYGRFVVTAWKAEA